MGVEESPFNMKAVEIKTYFDTKVFALSEQNWLSPENWGTLLQSLRALVTS